AADAPTAVRGSKRKQRRAERKASRESERATEERSVGPAERSAATAARPVAAGATADGSPSRVAGPPDGSAAPVEARKPRHRVLSFLFGLALIGVLAGLGIVAWKLFRTPTHEVPAVAGLTEDEALDLVDDFK